MCNLADFFIKEHPEKYDKTAGTRMDYENDENLKRIFAIIDNQKNSAIMVNTNQEGQIEEGEFGTYDLQKHQFKLTNEQIKQRIQKQLKTNIEKYAKDIYSAQEIKEMTEGMMPKNLDDMEKLATKGDREISEKAERLVKVEKPDEINRKNGKSKTERDELENASKVTIGQENDGQAEKNEVPDDVQKACARMGVHQIRGFFYANAAELESKVDGTRTDKKGNKVLIIEVYDNRLGCNKYYGFQDDRMVLYGNDSEINKAVKDVTGNVTQMGKLIKPLRAQEDQFIEYEDSQGLVIREKIEDGQEMSMQEINRYREDMEDTLTKYSQKIFQIKNDPLLTGEQKIERIQAIDDWCDKTTTKITRENDGSLRNDQNIDNTTDKQTLKIQEEIADNQGNEIGE